MKIKMKMKMDMDMEMILIETRQETRDRDDLSGQWSPTVTHSYATVIPVIPPICRR